MIVCLARSRPFFDNRKMATDNSEVRTSIHPLITDGSHCSATRTWLSSACRGYGDFQRWVCLILVHCYYNRVSQHLASHRPLMALELIAEYMIYVSLNSWRQGNPGQLNSTRTRDSGIRIAAHRYYIGVQGQHGTVWWVKY